MVSQLDDLAQIRAKTKAMKGHEAKAHDLPFELIYQVSLFGVALDSEMEPWYCMAAKA